MITTNEFVLPITFFTKLFKKTLKGKSVLDDVDKKNANSHLFIEKRVRVRVGVGVRI
jgi:hypothetical protein